MRTIENDIPEIFLELAREAFALGLAEVHLGFWYMDGDFISPIEWSLSLSKRDSNIATDYITATMGRNGSEEYPTAYVPDPSRNPLAGSYLDPEGIRAWMREPLESAGEFIPGWAPVEDPEDQKRLLEQWPLFESGVRSGWTMERQVGWEDLELRRSSAEESGRELPSDIFPTMKLSWEISNSFYNLKGHPAHRSTGAPVSVRGSSFIIGGKEKFQQPVYNDSGRLVAMAPLDRETVEDILSTNHPWFIRVAHDDEEWLHFPEALKSPKKTVDPLKFQRGETP